MIINNPRTAVLAMRRGFEFILIVYAMVFSRFLPAGLVRPGQLIVLVHRQQFVSPNDGST